MLYDHIQSLLKLIFSITFHYDQGKSRSILPFGSFFTALHGPVFTSARVVYGLCVPSSMLPFLQ